MNIKRELIKSVKNCARENNLSILSVQAAVRRMSPNWDPKNNRFRTSNLGWIIKLARYVDNKHRAGNRFILIRDMSDGSIFSLDYMKQHEIKALELSIRQSVRNWKLEDWTNNPDQLRMLFLCYQKDGYTNEFKPTYSGLYSETARDKGGMRGDDETA